MVSPELRLSWDGLELEILRREAQALLDGKKN